MTRSREELDLDLPFLVNGTLTPDEAAELEALLAQDPPLAAERDALAAIRVGMQAEEVRSPGEFGLARLLRDAGRDDGRDGGRDGAGGLGGSTPARAPSRVWMWQAAAAVAVVGLLAQTLLLRDSGAPGQDGYVLAGARLAPDQAAALVVGFVPSATEGQIRDLLLDAGVEITAGPSALGLYRLGPVEGVDPSDAAEALRAAPDIVESVENAEN